MLSSRYVFGILVASIFNGNIAEFGKSFQTVCSEIFVLYVAAYS